MSDTFVKTIAIVMSWLDIIFSGVSTFAIIVYLSVVSSGELEVFSNFYGRMVFSAGRDGLIGYLCYILVIQLCTFLIALYLLRCIGVHDRRGCLIWLIINSILIPLAFLAHFFGGSPSALVGSLGFRVAFAMVVYSFWKELLISCGETVPTEYTPVRK